MENKIHGLPPNKRFNLIHQDVNFSTPSCLPAKKRKNPPSIPANLDSDSTRVTTYCLPAKKRICALHPNLLSGESFLPIDLNLEYDPSSDQFQDEKKEQLQKHEQESENKNGSYNDNDEEEDGIICAICQSTDGDTLDPIVFCDGCDLMVHATCYGTPLTNAIPEGDWFCTRCKTTKTNKQTSLSCCFCATKGGAIKPTNDGRWAHIVCALFVPEVFFLDPEGREGIDCSMVPQRRWGKTCYVCEKTKGCVVDCSEEKCGLSFHVTCGVNEDLCIEYKQGRNKGDIVAGFCKKHTDLWIKQQATGKYKIVARNEEK